MNYTLTEILSLSLDVGEAMIKCGGEISRVEDTIQRICKSYGVSYIEVYAINSLILATLRDDHTSVTESRRITYINNNLLELEAVNELSREICKQNRSRKEILQKIEEAKRVKNKSLICFGHLLAAFSFTLFFQGSYLDALFSACIAFFIYLIRTYFDQKRINQIVYNFIVSFIIGFLALCFSKIGSLIHFDKMIIGDIMLLIPGLSLFISIHDIFKGDTLSGTNRFIEGVFLALSIAGGIGLSLLLGGLL